MSMTSSTVLYQYLLVRADVKRMGGGGFKLCYKLKEDLPAARCKKMNEVYISAFRGKLAEEKNIGLWFIM